MKRIQWFVVALSIFTTISAASQTPVFVTNSGISLDYGLIEEAISIRHTSVEISVEWIGYPTTLHRRFSAQLVSFVANDPSYEIVFFMDRLKFPCRLDVDQNERVVTIRHCDVRALDPSFKIAIPFEEIGL